MNAEIICIGTELLLGKVVDTNAVFLSEELAKLGVNVYYKTTVGDNLERIISTLQLAWERSDLLILSGGLGPTQDDLTREGVAGLLKEDLGFNEEAWNQIQDYFNRIGRSIPESNRRQAMFPKAGQVIFNHLGTAPALLVEKNKHILFALPGVPNELYGLWETQVKPYLKQKLSNEGNPVLTSRELGIVGIGESAMEEVILDLVKNQKNPTIAPYAGKGEVILRITAKSTSEIENIKRIEEIVDQIKNKLGKYIYSYNSESLEIVIGQILRKLGWRLAIAESCTGGLVSHRITNISGSSDYYLGGVNCYSNYLKIKLLGVPENIIQEKGAVSEEAARLMAEGVRLKVGVDVGLAVTGIAGPNGGTLDKPLGLVYLAVALPDKTVVERRIFPFDRIGNKEASAQAALVQLWQNLVQYQ